MFKKLRMGIAKICLVFLCCIGIAQADTSFGNCSEKNLEACDVSFVVTPTFAEMCAGGTQTEIFTIRNNSPTVRTLSNIRVLNVNGTINPEATIGVAPNNCGSTLAPGASCNIAVVVTPLTAETLNLRLVMGIDSSQILLETFITVTAIDTCNVVATVIPTFTDLCIGGFETRTFSFQNNSPIPVDITFVNIINSDLLPNSAVTIDPLVVNNCSGSLAAGASCNVKINVQPLAAGVINRLLRVGVNSAQIMVVEPINLTVTNTCNLIFSTPLPAPFNMSCDVTQPLTYILQNNSLINQTISYSLVDNGDVLPANAAVINAGASTCTGVPFLVPGQSCTIVVDLGQDCASAAIGTFAFDRTLTVTGTSNITAPTITSTITKPVVQPPAIDYLGNAAACAILGGSTVTNVPSIGTIVSNGDVCVAPGSAITGFPPGVITVPGTTRIPPDPIATLAHADLNTAITTLTGLPCTNGLTGQDLGGLTLNAGVACFNTSAQLTGTLTLSGNSTDVFVIQIGTTLTTASFSEVVLIGGALPENVYWVVGSSATIGTNTQFQGNILANLSITLTNGVTLLDGRALAYSGAVTMDNNLVTAP